MPGRGRIPPYGDRGQGGRRIAGGIFRELHELLTAHIPPFRPGGDEGGMFRGRKNFHLVVPGPVVIPGAMALMAAALAGLKKS